MYYICIYTIWGINEVLMGYQWGIKLVKPEINVYSMNYHAHKRDKRPGNWISHLPFWYFVLKKEVL